MAVFSVANINLYQPFVAHPCIAQQSVPREMPMSLLPQLMPSLLVSYQMSTSSVLQPMSPNASLPIEILKFLSSDFKICC